MTRKTPRIVLAGVTLDYKLHARHGQSRRSAGRETKLGGQIISSHGRAHLARAVDNVSLQINSGDRVALIGSNGSGKSSLLRMMAGVYAPTVGTLAVNGQVGTMFNIYQGMSDEATGRDFVYTRGLFMGARKSELNARIEEIVSFSGLGAFIDLPLRSYSDGMRVRLAFAIATLFEPDILLLDEIFGAGDQAFFDRAIDRMMERAASAGITVFATHWLELAERFCNRAIWMDRGVLRADGPIEDVFRQYRAVRESREQA